MRGFAQGRLRFKEISNSNDSFQGTKFKVKMGTFIALFMVIVQNFLCWGPPSFLG